MDFLTGVIKILYFSILNLNLIMLKNRLLKNLDSYLLLTYQPWKPSLPILLTQANEWKADESLRRNYRFLKGTVEVWKIIYELFSTKILPIFLSMSVFRGSLHRIRRIFRKSKFRNVIKFSSFIQFRQHSKIMIRSLNDKVYQHRQRYGAALISWYRNLILLLHYLDWCHNFNLLFWVLF